MKKIAALTLLFVSNLISAQDMEVKKGDFAFLNGQKEINVEFDYSKMTMMKEKKSEAQYVEERSADLNEKGKGTGDTWKKKWSDAPKEIWQPKFLELVNIVLSKENKDLNFAEGKSGAKYTLIVEVLWIFPGWDIAMMKQAAKVTTNLKFVETANKSNVVLEILSEEAPGDQYGSNFSNESRIGEGFAKTGKSLSKMILKKGFN